MKKPMALEPWLYLAAIGLFVIDILAMLVLSGGVRFRRRAAATGAILLALALAARVRHRARRRTLRRRSADSAEAGSFARLSRRFRAEGVVADPSRLRHHRRSRDRSRPARKA